jgi:uncharacterized SAM-binding protein YcdF (DUF218 family)
MRRKQRGGTIFRLLALFFLVLLLIALYAVRQPLMRMAAHMWVVSDPPERADAILVLGDDDFAGDRAARAAQLYSAGWAPVVVASGRRLRPYAGIAELIERDVENHGVPSTAVLRFSHDADNPIDEAKALNGFVSGRRWHRVLLVTSNYHTRRSLYIFRKVLPIQVSVDVIAVEDSSFDPDTWWKSSEGVEIFAHEIFGYGFAMWELR